MIEPRELLAGVLCGGFVAGMLALGDPFRLRLVGAVGIVVAVAGVLCYRHRKIWLESSGTAEALAVVLLLVVPLFGIHSSLGIGSGVGLTLVWLMIGFGGALWGVGCEMAVADLSG